MGYLTQDKLDGFSKYKYSARDTSPLSVYVMHPFWNFLVQYFPRWIAPNTMTFVGFILTALNFVLFSYYDWSFFAQTDDPSYEPIPDWVFLVAAINIFLAYTLDGIDGKQARRINLSGPLGELFDHGLDSYSASLIPVCLYSVFGRGERFSVEPIRFYYVTLTVIFNFYVSHWEKYNTGVLFLPWGYDLAMWGSVLMYMVAYLFGSILKMPLFGTDLNCGHFLEYVLHISASTNLPIVFYNIYRSYADKTGKMRSFTECIRPLIPLFAFLGVLTFWLHYSPNDIVNTDPRAVFLLTGTIFSNISCKLIVSQMSNTRCEIYNSQILYLTVCFFGSIAFPRIERILLYFILIFSTLAHWNYGTVVVQELCVHFNRVCFGVTLRSPVRKENDKKN